MSRTIRVALTNGVVRVALARPEVKNAFNAELIAELTSALRSYARHKDVLALVMAAEGSMFCAGADFNWMRAQKESSPDANLSDAGALYDMFYELYAFPHPTIARVQGGAFGGGAGLVACCDFVVMAENATLAFSEVRIGLVPATISPFVVRKIGEGRAREFFLTGAMISPAQALSAGLVNQVVPVEGLDGAVEECLSQIIACGPQALGVTKEILREVPQLSLAEARGFTAERIAKQRNSAEGQEGMAAFLEKRKPKWFKA